MYNTDLLIAAIDSIIESAHNRLTNDELQLLTDIRDGLAVKQDSQGVEESFFLLVNFLIAIKDYFEKVT